MDRLSSHTASTLPDFVARPLYDRATLRPGILHLGVGAFHRAHQAIYTEAALNHSGGDWGIIGASLRSDSVALQLMPQNGLYTVRSEDAEAQKTQLVGALQEVLVAPQAPEALDVWIANPAIKVVTLTITEKGYCLGADGWSLDHTRDDVQRDLTDPQLASTAIGVLARGLRRRCQQGGAPLSIISCDNLTENSTRLQQVLKEYLQESHPEVLPWLDDSVSFPCSMVDRIVPAASSEGLTGQAELLGLRDEAAVITEPFSQWVIEDNFATDIPGWEHVGVDLVPDIRPFETAKLRLLNASHSAIAYAGLLLNKETVSDVVSERWFKHYLERLMAEDLIPALQAPAGLDLNRYAERLIRRFANPVLHHRCAQIAMDGSEKIPQRWLETLGGLPGDSLLLRALAAWCYLVLGTDIPLDDPRRDQLLALRSSDAPDLVRLKRLLACLHLECDGNAAWRKRVEYLKGHLQEIDNQGVRSFLTGA